MIKAQVKQDELKRKWCFLVSHPTLLSPSSSTSCCFHFSRLSFLSPVGHHLAPAALGGKPLTGRPLKRPFGGRKPYVVTTGQTGDDGMLDLTVRSGPTGANRTRELWWREAKFLCIINFHWRVYSETDSYCCWSHDSSWCFVVKSNTNA